MERFCGRWNMKSSDNFDAYLQAIGIGFVMRKLGNAAKPTMIISQDSDTYTLRTESTFKTTEIKFKLGEEFDEERADGSKVKSTITLEEEGPKLVHLSKGAVDTKMTRELVDEDNIKMTLEAKDVTSVRTYVREKTA